MSSLQEVIQWMMENGYLVQIKGKFRVTAKFNKEITGQEVGIVMLGNTPVVQEREPPVTAITPTTGSGLIQTSNWEQLYLNFIKEAEVPARCEGRDGTYDINKYSADGMKAFRRAIEKEGINYQLLVKSTLLYYKTHRRFAKKIGSYMAEGLWRSDYQALLESAEQGTVKEHIENQIQQDERYTGYDLG